MLHRATMMEVAGSAGGILGSAWLWLGENQKEIAAICAILSTTVAVVGFVMHLRQSRHRRPY